MTTSALRKTIAPQMAEGLLKELELTPISERIKSLRKERRLTQKELALQSGVSFSFINQVEGGKQSIRLDTLSQLAEVFGYEVALVRKTESDVTARDKSNGKR